MQLVVCSGCGGECSTGLIVCPDCGTSVGYTGPEKSRTRQEVSAAPPDINPEPSLQNKSPNPASGPK